MKALVKFGPPTVSVGALSLVREWRQEEILEEDPSKSSRITFLGTEKLNVYQEGGVVVSFPGVHGIGWNYLTSGRTTFRTSCVFLPDEKSQGWGEHGEKGDISSPCLCHRLYGQKEPWGCKWFYIWKKKTLEAG